MQNNNSVTWSYKYETVAYISQDLRGGGGGGGGVFRWGVSIKREGEERRNAEAVPYLKSLHCAKNRIYATCIVYFAYISSIRMNIRMRRIPNQFRSVFISSIDCITCAYGGFSNSSPDTTS